MSATPIAPPDSTAPPRLLLLIASAVVLFAATLWLDTRQNTFPFFYHPDEPDKVDQLITGKWNFHHPLLMLGAAEAAKKALGLPDHEQTLVVLGRWCSALFTAGGVLCFAILGWRVRGSSGFWITGLLLLTQHQVFELAHYFKEDTALFFGVALVFLALHIHHRRPRLASALFAGAACGLCLSAKYLGAVMLIPAIVVMVAAQRGKRAGPLQWLPFALGLIAVAAAINFPVFTHLDVFTHSFGRETSLVAHGERGYTGGGQIAIFEYIRIFVVDTTPVVWLLVIAEILVQRTRRDAFDWTMAIFPFAFMLLLSCSTKTNDRYFLPATAGFHYLAALGAIDLPLLPPIWSARLRPWFLASLALLANLFLYPMGLAFYIVAFAHDDRAEMLEWIRANIPPTAVIAGENRADLPVQRRTERLAVQPLLPQRVIETKFTADLGATPAALAAQGIAYIVVSESDYGIFFRKAATAHLTPTMRQKRDFYETLFRDFRPLWERPRGTAIYLHPGLRIFRLIPG